jgi:regulator of protease activity HflC (stomatin/prohibitin superfamily)
MTSFFQNSRNLVIIAVALVVALASSVVIVPETHQGVVVQPVPS